MCWFAAGRGPLLLSLALMLLNDQTVRVRDRARLQSVVGYCCCDADAHLVIIFFECSGGERRVEEGY